MSVAVIAVPVLILTILLLAAIPAAMGLFIYRDANRRGMNAVLWTLVGVLAPGFVGMIIYLIVRGEHPDMQCRRCAKPVSAAFAVCPYCGAPLKEKCANCGFTLEAGWINCPSCGTQIPEEQRTKPTVTSGSRMLKGLLIAVIAVPLTLMILLLAAICLMRFSTASGWSSAAELTREKITADSSVSQWLDECDAQGEGVYLLCSKAETHAENNAYTCLLYRTDGYYYVDTSCSGGGLFSGPSVSFNCHPADYESGQDDTLFLIEFVTDSDRELKIKITDDGFSVPYILTDSEEPAFDSVYFQDITGFESVSTAVVKVAVGEELTDVCSIETVMYLDDEIVSGHGTAAENGASLAGEERTFTLDLATLTGDISDTRITVTLYDSSKQPLSVTELKPDDRLEWVLWMHKTENGIAAQELNLSYTPARRNEAVVKVAIDEKLSDVCHVSADLYAGDDIINSTGAQNADNSCIASEDFEFCLTPGDAADIRETEAVITLYDENYSVLYESRRLPFDEHLEWVLWLHDGGQGIECSTFNSDPFRSKQDFVNVHVSGTHDLDEVDCVEAALCVGDAIIETSSLRVLRDSEYIYANLFSFDVSQLESLADVGITITLYDSEHDPLYTTERFPLNDLQELLLRINRDEATGGYIAATEN